MFRLAGFVALTLIALVTFGDSANAQKKNEKSKASSAAATPDDYKAILTLRELVGKLAAVDAKSLTLSVEYAHLEPNPNYKPDKAATNAYQQIQSLYKQQKQAQAETNLVQRQLKLLRLAQQIQQFQGKPAVSPNGPYKIVRASKDFGVDVVNKLEVRKLTLEAEYDDKGNYKEYTKKELAALRGSDPGKPGYKAKIDDLRPGQLVTLYLGPPKKTKPASEDKPGDSTSTKDENPTSAVSRPTVTMVVIMQDSTSLFAPDSQPKKKK